MLLWVGVSVLSWCDWGMAAVRRKDVIEPPASLYPPDQFTKVAVLQWTQPEYAPLPASPDQAESYKAGNRRELELWAERAHQSGAELLVTPEFGVTGYPKTSDGEDQFKSPEEVAPYAETIPGPSTEFFGGLASRLGMYIEFDLAEKSASPGVFYNSAVLMGTSGQVVGSYRKRNLFGSERKFLRAGQGITVMDTPFGRIGMMICADVYHSPAIEDYRRAGVDALLVSAAWTVSGAMSSFRGVARNLRTTVLASNLADFPDSGVINPDGSTQSHIRDTNGLAFGYLKRRSRDGGQIPLEKP